MNVRTEPATVLKAAAVDVGFFGTKFAWGRDSTSERIRVDQFPSDAVPATRSAFGHRHLPTGIYVKVDGATYFVGPSVAVLGSAVGARSVQDGYVGTPEYKALLVGALAFIARRLGTRFLKITCLSVGTPMSTFQRDREALKAIAGGEHVVPAQPGGEGEITIHVLRVVVMPQPFGGFIALAERLRPSAMDERLLIVDVGGGATDWYVSENGRASLERCGSTPIGTLDCARALCEAVEPGASKQRALLADADRALRDSEKTVFIGAEYEISRYRPAVDRELRHIVSELVKRVQGNFLEFRCVFLTGGGARLLHPHLLERFPRLASLFLDDQPVFSNVQGFYIVAEEPDAE